MWDKIINLSTPEGRAVYRLVNVLVPQGVVGFLAYFVNEIQSIPADGDIQVVSSVTVAALVTAILKYRRDTIESTGRSEEILTAANTGMHGFINTEK